jgi:hypothetical protein
MPAKSRKVSSRRRKITFSPHFDPAVGPFGRHQAASCDVKSRDGGMKQGMLAGALALAMMGLLPFGATSAQAQMSAGYQGQITEVHISRIKAALRISAAQEPYWVPVEHVLMAIAREQGLTEQGSFMRRMGERVVAIALNSEVAQRVAAAAWPLLRTMDDGQKRTARALAHEMGLGGMVAMMN